LCSRVNDSTTIIVIIVIFTSVFCRHWSRLLLVRPHAATIGQALEPWKKEGLINTEWLAFITTAIEHIPNRSLSHRERRHFAFVRLRVCELFFFFLSIATHL
jgi:hypothetical protein